MCDDDFHPQVNEIVNGQVKIHDCTGKEIIIEADGKLTAVYPIDSAGVERKWRYAAANFPKVAARLKVDTRATKSILIAKTDDQFKTLWSAPIYNAGDYGTKILTNMGFSKNDFKFPKSIHTTMDCVYAVSENNSVVLDYFAGSGTTAHAIINLNRRYPDSRRKYILTEMGEYFSTVTKPRIIKAIYADSWNKGLPENRNTGLSHMFKYMRLESYEDALNNITLKKAHW